MKSKLIIMCISCLLNVHILCSQHYKMVDNWKEYVEELAAETDQQEQIEALYADLSYLSEHPLDLNHLTQEQLKRLPFLSDRQIEALLAYPERYGKMVTIYELKQIEALDWATLSLLLPFVTIGENQVEKWPLTVSNLFNYGENELLIRYDQCFQQKSGYGELSDSILQRYPNRHYLGEPFYHSLRYAYTFDDRLQLGFVAEKDAGEPFAKPIHKGYDSYSAHLFLKDMNRLKSLAIGDYKVSFGQGLAISHEFTLSRSATVTQIERRSQGFRRHYSTNEQDFFRGAALTLALGNWELSGFYSYRKMDAAVDSLTFPSLKTDGLHRLPRDWEKRRTVPLQSYGGHLQWATSMARIGVTALGYSFGRYQLQPVDKPYSRFYLSGSHHFNISVDYLLRTDGLKFFGETAMDKQKALATLNNLQWTPASYFTLLLSHRYYDKRYQALFGNAFRQGSTVQNEQGFYMGLQFTPLPYWKLSLYGDWFRFPWVKYGVDAPSSGVEYMAEVDYTPNAVFSTYLRYKYREKEKNQTAKENNLTTLVPYQQHRLRYQLVFRPGDWVLKTAVDGVIYQELNQADSKGYQCSQSVAWRPNKIPLGVDSYFAWFHTDDYDSRVSSYEKNILYAFQMPTFYGKGFRLALTVSLDLGKRLSLFAKLAHTHYLDRDQIGSDTEQIEGSNKTDLYALLRWKF